jgi:superfamily II DNA or RNA helicase
MTDCGVAGGWRRRRQIGIRAAPAMAAPLDTLLAAIRRAGISGAWSAGIKLAREGAIVGRSERDDLVVVHVRPRGEAAALVVRLFVADGKWRCDCGGPSDPCPHVAAAIIALTQAKEQGRALPAAEQGCKLRYRLRNKGGGLSLERFLVKADGTQEVLRAALSGPQALGPEMGIVPAPQDLVIDRLCGSRTDGLPAVIAASRVAELFGALAGVADVRLEDRPVKLSPEALAPRASVVEQGDGAALVIERDRRITEVAGGGLAFIGQTLHLLTETELAGTRLERLPLRRTFARAELGRLVAEVLPDIARRMPVEIRARLPRFPKDLGPRVTFATDEAARPVSPDLVARIDTEDGRLGLTFEAAADEDAPPGSGVRPGTRIDGGAGLRAWQAGQSLVALDGGGWARLPVDWLARFGPRVAELLAARRADGTLEKAALPALAELCDDLQLPRPPGVARLAPLLEGVTTLPTAALPADLTATLRPYQQKGVDWLCFLRDAGLGAVLADDMGLGKTLQTLAAMAGRALVVCPRSVVHNWAAEIRRFRPALTFHIYHGPKRALDPAAFVTLTTYSVLRLDAEALAREAWDMVVLDEAQAIKNPDSQVARAAFALPAGFRVALSGTPVENRLDELWSLLHFTSRGLLGGRAAFDERHARPIAAGAAGAAERLRRKIRPFVLRRLKRDVAPELPPRLESILYCELDEPERAVYDAVRAATRAEVIEKLGAGGSVLAALEALLRLRQAACHSGLVPGQPSPARSSAKLERLVEALADAAADGHKALVFSQWTSLLDRVGPQLTRAGIRFNRLDGSTRDRGAVVAEFQDEKGPPVMLLSLKAGGTGLNLTAADHVFLLDPWWNPAVESQAADRAHRIGQDKPVTIYRLVAKDTVEEGILALQERKRSLSEAALGEADQAVSLTRQDLLELLG